MRWEALFADLEGQLADADRAELAGELDDRTRREVARLRLVDRLRPAVGCRLDVATVGGEQLTGALRAVGADWLLLALDWQAEALIPVAAVESVRGLPRLAAEPDSQGAVASRLGLGYALRLIARDRAPVRLVSRDGRVVEGTIDRVGADFVDVSEHPAGEPRRRVAAATTVGVAALAVVLAG